ncbi:SKP1/ASK-Interacting protein 23, F-box/DUF295 Ancestral 11 [Hibiscus trionum]|uniref:SKP1/ASK-Interacting protein 23, F-box/DUF295 Ancestral 11 n=1 Tax=Hibiscus trionum TaxID=183268 RepID=A0A9W7LK26_HIBTR|nr:SKP1/ASK-Interacting protein 23, F-box/DUF295 Ancestral 11 [Hibiscus trionum]
MGGWCELSRDLVRMIEGKVDLYEDKVKCRCVCWSWRLALPKMPHQKQDLLPWLLVPLKTKTEIGSGTSFGFFDPLEKKLHCLQLSDPHKGMLFRGSSHGWVVNIGKNNSICAINPLTGAQVNLPPRTKFPDVLNYRADKPGKEYAIRTYDNSGFRFLIVSKDHVRNGFLDKVILSSSPQSKEDFVAVAIYGNFSGLAYCKRGSKKWSFLDRRQCCDVIFHQQQLYAVYTDGSVMVCDIHSSLPKMTPFVPKLSESLTTRFYLVESFGGLIMVHRDVGTVSESDVVSDPDSLPPPMYKTCGFRIFKLDTTCGEWYEIQSIGDDMLFLGWNSSFSLSCKNFPAYAGNCIYFTDDNLIYHYEGIVGGFDIGIFNLSDGSIQHLPGYKTCDSELSIWPPPIWFMPNPLTSCNSLFNKV